MIKKIILTTVICSLIIFFTNTTSAAPFQCCADGTLSECKGAQTDNNNCNPPCTGGFKCTDLASMASANNTAVKLTNPLGENVTAQQLIGKIISAVLGVVGSIALAMFVYGGFLWMTAAGNSQQVDKGKNVLVWATIGLVVIFSSYALVEFVFKGLGV